MEATAGDALRNPDDVTELNTESGEADRVLAQLTADLLYRLLKYRGLDESPVLPEGVGMLQKAQHPDDGWEFRLEGRGGTCYVNVYPGQEAKREISVTAYGKQYAVTLKRWSQGWELHIAGEGATQCRSLEEADAMVRDYLACKYDLPLDPGSNTSSYPGKGDRR